MKQAVLSLCILFGLYLISYGQNLESHRDLVDLRGKVSTTIFTNTTIDTIRIQAESYYYTPYYEQKTTLTLSPGKSDSLKVSMAHPGFIILSNYGLKLYSAPGSRVHAYITSISSGKAEVNFTGDMVQENDYYLAYQNHFKGFSIETSLFYSEAAKMTDLNAFPGVADSIRKLASNFLDKYAGALPSYFKSFEESRLLYNAAYRKYNVLLDREFKTGQKNLVNKSYFDFENSVNLNPENFILNSSFIDYAGFFIFFRSEKSPNMSKLITLADSMIKPSINGDALKMNLLSRLFRESKAQYDLIYPKLAFYDTQNKYAIDSIITLKSRLPVVGKLTPQVKLIDAKGDSISLSVLKGKPMIINFWASWCAPCLEALPYENLLHDKYSEKGLVVVNICVETDRKKWELLTKEKALRMINLYATAEEYVRIKKMYNIESLPRSILIANNGTVLNNYYKSTTVINDKEIEDLLSSSDR